MLTPMSVLDYANPTRRRATPIVHTWLLPLLSLPGTLGSMRWYGDEYGALVVSNFPGFGLLWLLPERLLQWIEGSPACFWVIFGVNLLALTAAGLVLDLLRARHWIYGLCIALFLFLLVAAGLSARVSGPGLFQAARDYQPDALCVAWSWSVYLVAAGAVAVILLARLLSLVKPLADQPPLRLAGIEEGPVEGRKDDLRQDQQR